MKIYTRTGDDGTTSLFGGMRVSKDNGRIEAYGAVDELNAALGLAASLSRDESIARLLQDIQRDLFAISTDLATPPDRHSGVDARTIQSLVENLEKDIDKLETSLSPLHQFILPGGHPCAAAIHMARTICRRAERRVIALGSTEAITPATRIYLNRLSDYLFVLGRYANHRHDVEETTWDGRRHAQREKGSS